MKVNIKKLNPSRGLIPKYSSTGAAAFDLHAAITYEVIAPGAWLLIKTGLAMEIPEGYGMFITPRSGLALKDGITIVNSPGLIDSDYRGEIGIILYNLSEDPFEINKGDRIAQACILKVEKVEFEEVEELSKTNRGTDGFGSTGISTNI